MAHTDERQFDNLLDNLVSELAMEQVGDPEQPIIAAPPPQPAPNPAVQAEAPPSGRTWLAVTGIMGAAVATLGVAAFVIFGGTNAEAANVRTTATPAETAPQAEPTPTPAPQVVPVVVPQPAPTQPANSVAATTPTGDEPAAEKAEAPTKKKRKKRKRRRPRKKTTKTPPSGDRFEDL